MNRNRAIRFVQTVAVGAFAVILPTEAAVSAAEAHAFVSTNTALALAVANGEVLREALVASKSEQKGVSREMAEDALDRMLKQDMVLVGSVAQDTVTVAELKAENEALRRENQKLRRELVRRRGGEPVIDMSQKTSEPAPADDTARITDDGGYWLATKSMKRHNSKCRYYKMGKGRPCKKDEGTPCKKCGG